MGKAGEKMHTIKNEYLEVSIEDKGAEIKSVKFAGKEYMWHGDPAFWGRTSPVLFPLVGSVNNGEYRHEGNTYKMGQHGLARDMVFSLLSKEEDKISFLLEDTAESYIKFPFKFQLYIAYELIGRRIKVSWKVVNTDDKTLVFSIGAHPAFMCPITGEGNQTDYSLYFEKAGKPVDQIKVGYLSGGLYSDEREVFKLSDGIMNITYNLFDRDALILEGNQADKVSILDKAGNPYVSVLFDTDVMGIWSPAGKHAPFICIEPWYGRCDKVGYDGEWKDREYSNFLEKGESFEREYEVEV